MSAELEAAGAMVDAGLVAKALEPDTGGRHAGHGQRCLNCEAELLGAYCHACGQSAHVHRSLGHLIEEILHGVLHFDSKGWRTLPLLVARPGLLTKRYTRGQRARYVSPLALFLFTVFLMFFASSFTTLPESAAQTEIAVEEGAGVAEAREARDQAQAQLAEAEASGQGVEAARQAADSAERELKAAEQRLESSGGSRDPEAEATDSASLNPIGWRESLQNAKVNTGNARLDALIVKKLANPDLLLYKLKNNAYKFSFMLIPISLPFLWLMFALRRGITLYDHGVFALYSLSFMSLLFLTIALLAKLPFPMPIDLMVTVGPPLHMFLQLREAYDLSVGAALWRTAALLLICFAVFVLFLLFIALVAIA